MRVKKLLPVLIIALLLIIFILVSPVQKKVLKTLFPNTKNLEHPRKSIKEMSVEHLGITFVSASAAVIFGILTGLTVTKKRGKPFLPIVRELSALAQTIPPAAVLALAIPVLGFGLKSTIIALFLYSILPVIYNTITGIQTIPEFYIEAAKGSGLTDVQILFHVELPLAANVIFTGVRIAVVLNIATATIGALVGAGGLGVIIISGINQFNAAYLFSGAIVTAGLAVTLDMTLGMIGNMFYKHNDE